MMSLHPGVARRWIAAPLAVLALAAAGGATAPSSHAQPTGLAIFEGADLALGERLIREHRCTECHVKRVGGDGRSIYRPQGRINTPGFLRGMVEQCNTELNLGLFPEDVTAVAAVLQRDHYRFR
jgi:hypothetical protein